MSDTGWLDVGTAVNVERGVSDWTTTSNAVSEDANYAENVCPSYAPTDDLWGYNLSESIPAGQQVDGVEVRFKGYGSTFQMGAVRIVKGASSPGDNGGDSSYLPASNDWSNTLGGPTDMWGTGFDIDDVKDSSFGVWIAFFNDSGAQQTAYIDVIQIKIYYSEAPILHYPLPPHYVIP